jgi:3-oxoacyl-[acyl-carrier-protein] synthase II
MTQQPQRPRRRVVVTGMGAVTPVGNDVSSFFDSLLAGRSGVSFLTEFSTERLRSDIGAQVTGFDPYRFFSRKEVDIYGRVTHFSMGAMVEAMAQAGFAEASTAPKAEDDDSDAAAVPLAGLDPFRAGCLMSTGMGAVDVFEREVAKSAARGPRAVSPFFIPGVMPNAAAALGTMRWGLMGPSYSIASACATGAHAIATAALMIEADEIDLMIAGGAEAATRANCVAGFGNARAIARSFEGDPTRASRPYDKKRSGFVMGEGAGALVLEEEQHALARGAKPLAYVAGWGSTSDATHVTRPHPEGLGLAMATERAIRRAGISKEDVGYINAHATSTPQGDVAEYTALRRVFGDRLAHIPVSATKSMVGHLLGGAAAAESIATICSLQRQMLHPSINLDELDPIFELDVVQKTARPTELRYALKSSAGFGGHNCVLIFERYPTLPGARRALSPCCGGPPRCL